mgnify:CR=1 FL=1
MRISLYLFIISFFFVSETFSNENNKDLLKLKKLLDAGIINTEEFDSAKKIITEKDYKKKVLESKKKKKDVTTEIVKPLKKEKKVVTTETVKPLKKEKLTKIENVIDKKTRKEINELWKKKVLASIENEKNDLLCKLVLKKTKEDKKINYCLKNSDILKLGSFKKIKFPKFILDEFKGCKTNYCIRQHAGKKVYELFVRRTSIYHARYPGAMIEGMAWFEIFYLDMLKKNQKYIDEYFSNNGYIKKSKQKKLHSLIKTNKSRIKMREALGFTVYDDFYDVIEGEWLLAEFLNKDKLKASKVKISADMKKKKLLIEKYKSTLAKYRMKLEEEKQIK